MELTATPSGLLATFSPSAASSPPPASSLAPDRPCRRTGRGLPGLPPSRAGKRLSTFLAAEGLAGCRPAARRCPSPRLPEAPRGPAARPHARSAPSRGLADTGPRHALPRATAPTAGGAGRGRAAQSSLVIGRPVTPATIGQAWSNLGQPAQAAPRRAP